MSKELGVIVLGLWVILLTQLGIPGSWRTTLLVLTGIIVAGIGFALRAEKLSRGGRKSPHHTFVENGSPHSHHEHERKEGIGSLN